MLAVSDDRYQIWGYTWVMTSFRAPHVAHAHDMTQPQCLLGKGRLDPRATPRQRPPRARRHDLRITYVRTSGRWYVVDACLIKMELSDIIGSKYGNMFPLVLLMIISPNIPLANGQQGIVQ